ncbi:hypothetical protein NMY22_g12806 [Coprinellus aureogranulatus]|nr:hypothetical protein NMY22_g12806 [Coprinellus aureogranulatus]
MYVARASAHARAEVLRVVKIAIYDRVQSFLGSASDCDALFDMLNIQGFLWNDSYETPVSPVGDVDSLLGQLPLSWRFSRLQVENEEAHYAYSLFWSLHLTVSATGVPFGESVGSNDAPSPLRIYAVDDFYCGHALSSMPPYPKTRDDSLPELMANARWLSRVENAVTVDGVFIGSECSKLHIVPVPVRDCLQPQLRAIDAVFRLYVRCHSTLDTIVYDMSDYLAELYSDEYPSEWTEGGLAYDYSFFTSDDVCASSTLAKPLALTQFCLLVQPMEVRNQLLRSFEGGEDLRIRGSILVMRSDGAGTLCSMEESDFEIVKKLTVRVFKEGFAPDVAILTDSEGEGADELEEGDETDTRSAF